LPSIAPASTAAPAPTPAAGGVVGAVGAVTERTGEAVQQAPVVGPVVSAVGEVVEQPVQRVEDTASAVDPKLGQVVGAVGNLLNPGGG
jgi:hypothetical protein